MHEKPRDLSSLGLHLIAMALMLCDHLWATVVPGNNWLTWLGRLAFPIFAFLAVEGYHHTRDLKQYLRRLLLFALLSELPFNLMYSASWVYPFQQNVLWTFLIGLLCLRAIDAAKRRWRPLLAAPVMALEIAVFALLATLAMTDYMGYGVLTMVVFHLFRGRKWYHFAGQALGLYLINWQLMGGMVVPVGPFQIPQQGAAVLALLFLWCYRGRQGYHSKWTRWLFYGFYPVHMLILGLLSK